MILYFSVIMRELKEFTIPFVGLKLGPHTFEYKITKAFFDHFEFEDFNDVDIDLEVILDKKTTLLEFTMDFKGTVNVNCDVTNEPYNQNIEGGYHFIVKFGDEFNDENEDLLIIPHGSYEVNIQQYIYESIVLETPSRFVHPGIEDGTLKSDILDKLKELSPKAKATDITIKKTPEESTDPRWDTLKKLLNDK